MILRLLAFLTIVSPIVLLPGCGEAPKTPATELSLRKLASYYGMFITAHKGQGPKSEAELKAFIKDKSADVDFDKLFRSERDNQAYVVLYSPATKAGPADVIAHEKDGVDGKRFVAMGTTEVKTMDEAAFKQALGKR